MEFIVYGLWLKAKVERSIFKPAEFFVYARYEMKRECIQKIPRAECSFYPRDEYYLKILRAKTSENVYYFIKNQPLLQQLKFNCNIEFSKVEEKSKNFIILLIFKFGIRDDFKQRWY